MSLRRSVLVVTGLTREAGLAAGEGVITVAGGGQRPALLARLDALDTGRLAAVLSFGLAGGLDPALRPGDLVLGTSVVSDDGRLFCAEPLVAALREGLGSRPRTEGAVAGGDAPLLDPASKAAMHERTGAVAVDMESHIAGAYAARHGLPFGVVRVVCDPAGRRLPRLVGQAMRPDGGIDLPAVLGGLARDPRQIVGLVRAGLDAGAAFRTLGRVGGLLGHGRLGGSLGLHL